MDISELLPLVGALLFVGLCGFTWWQARTVSAKGVRLAVRVLALVMGLVAGVFAASLLVIGLGYTRRMPALVSPDGKHVALTTYTVNSGAASDIAEVSVRSAGVPYSYRVYVGPGAYSPMAAAPEPSVSWTDATHLTIRFRRYKAAENSNGEQGCAAGADDVTVTCEETLVLPPK